MTVFDPSAPTSALARAIHTAADNNDLTLPCRGRHRDRWTSNDPDARAWAAAVCVGRGCPVHEPCRDAGRDAGWLVWGGHDFTPPPGRVGRPPKGGRE